MILKSQHQLVCTRLTFYHFSGLVVGLLTLLLSSAAMSKPTPAHTLIQQKKTLLIAHRGASSSAPENTIPAFEQALYTGADLVELDYYQRADGKQIVIHDEWIGNQHIPSGTNTPLVDSSNRFQEAYGPIKAPFLGQAIDVILGRSTPLIEYKRQQQQLQSDSKQDAKALIRLLRSKKVMDKVVVQSFDPVFLNTCRRLAPNLALGLLVGGEPTAQQLDQAIKHIKPQVIGWSRPKIKSDMISNLQSKYKLKVWVWFGGDDKKNDPSLALDSIKRNIDGIITDHPGTVRSVIDWHWDRENRGSQ